MVLIYLLLKFFIITKRWYHEINIKFMWFFKFKFQKCILDNITKPLYKCKVLFIPNEPYLINNLDKYYKRLELDGFKKENLYIYNENESEKFENLDRTCFAFW